MFGITKVDSNFAVKTGIEKDDIKFYSIDEKPIVYYGSSITQGGCALRPGMS